MFTFGPTSRYAYKLDDIIFVLYILEIIECLLHKERERKKKKKIIFSVSSKAFLGTKTFENFG